MATSLYIYDAKICASILEEFPELSECTVIPVPIDTALATWVRQNGAVLQYKVHKRVRDDPGLFVRIQSILQSIQNNAMIPMERGWVREKKQ